MISNSEDFLEKLQVSLGTAKALLTDDELEFAITQAENELVLSYPITERKLQLWGIDRAKRHSLDILRIQSAHRFKYKQLSLNDRFNHYDKLIKDMDDKFEHAMNTDPDLWGIEFDGILGFYIDNGFVYNKYGEDVTKFMDSLVG